MKDDEQCVLVSVVNFEDGLQSAMPLCRGTRDACEAAADRIPAVSYNGAHTSPVVEAFLSIVTQDEYDAIMATNP